MTTPPITGVSGGVAGMSATYSHVLALAARYDAAGDRMRGWAATGATTMADPDLLESAVLAPVTFAEAEAQVLAATTGPQGVLTESVSYETDAVLIRATVTAFAECDRLVADSFRTLDYLAGRAIGTTAPGLAAGALLAVGGAALAWHLLPTGARGPVADRGAAAVAGMEEWLDEHPGVVEHLADGGGGLLDGVWDGLTPGLPGGPLGLDAFTPTTADAAGLLAGWYGREGPPHVGERGDLSVPLGDRPPTSLHGLLRHLQQTNDLSPADRPGDQGTIEIQTLHLPDGSIRHVVYLPGTDDLATTPFSQDGDVRDLPADLALIDGQDTTYEEGIRQAMAQAHIGPGDPVLLVGHSQGGMVAAHLLSHDSGFQVTNVVTAGSPIAHVTGFPEGSHVLSLENRGDVVPLLDGGENPDTVQHVTVQFDDHETSIVGNHDLGHYVDGARAAELSTDPSIREQLASLHELGYLDAQSATSQVFQITR